ncbi:MAG: hypothetical protein WAW33_00805 [Minisyncoccia bacterium]
MQLINKNKFVPWFLCLLLILQGTGLYHITSVFAGNASTSAGVNNKVPTYTGNVAESPASYATTPTAVGADVTFKVTATDKNNDKYYLAVCTTAAVTAHASAAPTCDVGTWKVSAETSSGSEATAAYTTLQGDASSNNWYAYVCDKNANSLCTTVDSGTGDSGSPFIVNHAPTFTVFADDAGAGKAPGATVTWTSTSTDSDSDTVTLYVCKDNDFTGTDCGVGGKWCNSNASASDPTCNVAMPSIMQDKDWEAFGYIVDAHGAASAGVNQGTDSTLTISNVAPSITASSIIIYDTDGSGDMTLATSQDETTGFKVALSITDANSCLNASTGHEIASAAINVRRSGITAANCDATGEYNPNNCYPDDYASWNTSCTQTGTCGGAGDDTIEWECTFPLQYLADPTVTNSTFDAQYWIADAKAIDDDTADSGFITSADADGTEMGQFLDYHLNTVSINYGSMDPGAASSDQATTLEATGNVGLDETLYGTNMASGGDTILVGQQKYKLTAGGGWTGTALVVTPGNEAELNLKKSTVVLTPETKDTYWVLQVPDPQATGTYSGTNTIEGKVGEYADW